MTYQITPTPEDFNPSKPQLVYAKIINDIDTPVSAFLKIAENKPYSFLFESVQGGEIRGRYSFLGFSPDIIWKSSGDISEISRDGGKFKQSKKKPIESLRSLQKESSFVLPKGIPPMAAGLFGYLGYDLIRQVENLPTNSEDPINTPDAIMVRPSLVAIFDSIAQEIIIASPVYASGSYDSAVNKIHQVIRELNKPINNNINQNSDIHGIVPNMGTSLKKFTDKVNKAKNYILSGDIFQVVIGQRFSAPYKHKDFSLYRSLRRLNPSPFMYFLNFDDHSVVGSSPEILVRLRNKKITIRPIAGTRPRGKTESEDLQNEKDLISDPKECSEHLMLLDLGRNDVGRVAKPGTVEVTEKFIVERYSHVMHIVSNVEGEILDGCDAITALFAGFPAGTVSGAPKVRAMEIINELEDEKRGIYAGAIGYIGSNGDMDTAIALRTGIIKNKILHVRAGAGIVMDSKPKLEFEETLHKSAALFKAAEQSGRFD
jgi:anthranilate synthase component 1